MIHHRTDHTEMRKGFPAIFKLIDSSSTRQGIIALSDQGVTSFTNFITGIILARVCGKEQLGLYVLGFSLVLFIMGIQDSLILSPLTVYSPRLKGIDLARYYGSTLIHQLIFSGLSVLGLSIAGLLLSSGFDPQQFAPVLWALVIAITFMLLREYARRVCFARLQMKAALILDLGVCVVQIGGLLLLSHLGNTVCKESLLGNCFRLWSSRYWLADLDTKTLQHGISSVSSRLDTKLVVRKVALRWKSRHIWGRCSHTPGCLRYSTDRDLPASLGPALPSFLWQTPS